MNGIKNLESKTKLLQKKMRSSSRRGPGRSEVMGKTWGGRRPGGWSHGDGRGGRR